jgi:hypothetical protein
MKKAFGLSLLLLLIACGSENIVFVTSLNKRVKIFKNDRFQFYYPKKWKLFDIGQRYNLSSIIIFSNFIA